ncbi:PhzF family phenazine biosynthesis protein [Saccharomonospora amisosensis]|uniref:PhzF family phenazine biosynthesis protein n=1 Tax=Saccharomonospora amisosensis TaxID=1128677 RepID=A0A7X5ZQ11_9PSEU|nr:PhzF family phenazine biosynthesis isomerase [Saccharomonospora amisosensis]NIJ10855.1 PhzF family phenazine biosynthesis protein [Saccharomonospora amisosensis]
MTMTEASESEPLTGVLRYAAFDVAGRGGNPAGVVLDATGMSEAHMLRIAAEVGFSETAFLLRDPAETAADRFRVRYFSPLAEVDFCGHATIATAVALADRSGTGELSLATRAGEVSVRTDMENGRVRATLTSVTPSVRKVADTDLDAALAALGWDPAELDPALPPRIANAGNDHLVLGAATRSRLAELNYEQRALGALMADRGWTTVHLVWRESATMFHARDPFPPGGVFEDPATGAAAAAFGGYLRQLRLIDPPATIHIRQGEDMGRPSDLHVGISADPDAGIAVSGTAAAMPD